MTAINPQAVRGPVTAVPVVAGKGVRFVEDVQNNRVVAEVDETVLWTGAETDSQITTGTSIQLSEAYTNFKNIRVYYMLSFGATDSGGTSRSLSGYVEGITDMITGGFALGLPSTSSGTQVVSTETNAFVFSANNATYMYVATYGHRGNINFDTLAISPTPQNRGVRVLKVVGINRVSASA